MGIITLLVLTLILAAHINAYPQEAEIPATVPRKSSADIDYNAAHGRSFITPPEFFMRMFGDDYYYPPFHPARFFPPIPFYPVVPPPVVVPMIPFPDLSKLPDNYSNSTREVKTVNGQKVVINQKINKYNDGNGFFVSHFHTLHSGLDDQGYNTLDDRARSTPDEKTLPNNDEQSRNRDSSTEDLSLVRKRRDVIGGLMQNLFRIIIKVQEAPIQTLKAPIQTLKAPIRTLKTNEKLVASGPADKPKTSGQISSKESNKPLLRSLESDIKINFGNAIHKINVDAELIGNKKLHKEKNTKAQFGKIK